MRKVRICNLKIVLECGGNRILKKIKFLFLLKFNMFCMFWIILMC